MSILNTQRTSQFAIDYARSLGEPECDLFSGRTGEMIETFKKGLQHDEFYTVFNLKYQKLTWHLNLDRHLGYAITDDRKDINFFFDLIHPYIKDWVMAYVFGITSCLKAEGLSKMEYLNTRYNTQLPLQRSDGTFILIRHTSMPFQFDEFGNVLAYLNKSTVVNVYKGEPVNPHILHTEGNTLTRLYEDEIKFLRATALFLNIKSSESLQKKRYWDLVDAALTIPPINRKLMDDQLEKILVSNKGKPYNKNGIRKQLSDVKDILIQLLSVTRNKAGLIEAGNIEKYLSDLNTPHTLLHFLNDCRILDVLKIIESANNLPSE